MQISRREHEVLYLIAEEHTTQEIAQLLFMSTLTVDTHRKAMIYKLNVRNTAGLIRKGFEEGFLTIHKGASVLHDNFQVALAH